MIQRNRGSLLSPSAPCQRVLMDVVIYTATDVEILTGGIKGDTDKRIRNLDHLFSNRFARADIEYKDVFVGLRRFGAPRIVTTR